MTDENPKAAEAVSANVPDVLALSGRSDVIAKVQPTQVRRPWRSTVRTIFQALLSFAALAPLLAAAVEEATGYDLAGVPFVVTALLVCAAVTRVMAVPAVEVFLRTYVPWLAAAPKA